MSKHLERLLRLRVIVGLSGVLSSISFVVGCGSGAGVESDAAGGSAGASSDTGGSAAGDYGTPTRTSALRGNDQSAVVDTAVAVAPAVLVTDAEGRPVPGVEVVFVVTSGGGVVTGETTRTGADGVAEVGSWILGPTPGPQRLTASIPGLPPVEFNATATPDERGAFVIEAGDGQQAPAGAAVTVVPTVSFTLADGSPVVGRTITLRVLSGGGTVTPTSIVTGADGLARVTSWVLGPEPGLNELEASAEGMPPLVFSATALAAGVPTVTASNVVTGLNRPWDIGFLPDGTMIFTERRGVLSAFVDGEVRVLVQPADVNAQDQSGMLGLAVDPDFATNRFVYTFMSSNLAAEMQNRVVRWTLRTSLDGVDGRSDIVTGIDWGNGGAHSGGQLAVGPDGNLWITTGDLRTGSLPQDVTRTAGKVLRVTRAGAPAPGNPSFGVSGADPRVYAYGFRNIQGIAFRPGTNQPYVCEHGPGDDRPDEVTGLSPGVNGGWNPLGPGGAYSGYTGALMTDTSLPNVVGPAVRHDNSSGMSGCDFLRGEEWRSYNGSLAIGFLAGNKVAVATLRVDGAPVTNDALSNLQTGSRFRAVVQGPDGSLYLSTDSGSNDRIIRVTPE